MFRFLDSLYASEKREKDVPLRKDQNKAEASAPPTTPKAKSTDGAASNASVVDTTAESESKTKSKLLPTVKKDFKASPIQPKQSESSSPVVAISDTEVLKKELLLSKQKVAEQEREITVLKEQIARIAAAEKNKVKELDSKKSAASRPKELSPSRPTELSPSPARKDAQQVEGPQKPSSRKASDYNQVTDLVLTEEEELTPTAGETKETSKSQKSSLSRKSELEQTDLVLTEDEDRYKKPVTPKKSIMEQVTDLVLTEDDDADDDATSPALSSVSSSKQKKSHSVQRKRRSKKETKSRSKRKSGRRRSSATETEDDVASVSLPLAKVVDRTADSPSWARHDKQRAGFSSCTSNGAPQLSDNRLMTAPADTDEAMLGERRAPRRVKAVVGEFVRAISQAGVTGLKKEFAALNERELLHEAFKANLKCNRYTDNVCLDATRVVLHLDVPRSRDYVNANWVRAANAGTRFIATQGPLKNTVGDFWRMCYQEKVRTILMLCNVVERGSPQCEQYWPLEKNSEETFGIITVHNKQIQRKKNFESISLELSAFSISRKPMRVELIHFKYWPEGGVTSRRKALFRVLRLVRKRHRGLCVVHCSDGAGRTGTAITIVVVIQRLLKGAHVKLNEVVSELRGMRAHFVHTEAQYVFIATMVFDYIEMKFLRTFDKEIRGFLEKGKRISLERPTR